MTNERRPGGRSARVRAAVLAALITEVAESGLAGISLEKIAARAGVHKTTLYRRWGSRAELIADLVSENAAQNIPVPDTGNVMGDLRALLHGVVAAITSVEGSVLVRAVILEAEHVEELRTITRAFWSERFAAAAGVVRRGIARGELPDSCDPDLLVEQLVGPLYLRRFVSLQPVDAAYADQVLEATLGGYVRTRR